MEAKRLKRKAKDRSGTPAVKASAPHLSNTTHLQAGPPAIRLKHKSSPATSTPDGAAKLPAGRTDPSETPVNNIAHTVDKVLNTPGQPLDSEARAKLESRTGHDLGHVRVHTDEQSAASARALEARAYTVGSHMVFGEGQYAPTTPEGQKLPAQTAHALHRATPEPCCSGCAAGRWPREEPTSLPPRSQTDRLRMLAPPCRSTFATGENRGAFIACPLSRLEALSPTRARWVGPHLAHQVLQ
jgi:hypothetical protein